MAMPLLLLPALAVVARAQINPGNQFFSGPLAPAPLTPQGQPPPDGVAQYTYGYKTEDPGQATYSEQNEQRNGNAVTGFYSTLLPDGRVQVVNYVADEGGYRATVTYQTPDGIPLPGPQQPPGSPPPRAEPRQPTFLFSGPLPPLTADLGPGFGRRRAGTGGGGDGGFGAPAKREVGPAGGSGQVRSGQNGPALGVVQAGRGAGSLPLRGGRPKTQQLKKPGPQPHQPTPQHARQSQPPPQNGRPNHSVSQHVRQNQPPPQHGRQSQSPPQHGRPEQPAPRQERPPQGAGHHVRHSQPPAPRDGQSSLQHRRLPVRPESGPVAAWNPETNTAPAGRDGVSPTDNSGVVWRLPANPPPPPQMASAWLVADNTIKHGWASSPSGRQPNSATPRPAEFRPSLATQETPPLSSNRAVTATVPFSARQGRLSQQPRVRTVSVRSPRQSGFVAVETTEPAIVTADAGHPLAIFINAPAQQFSPPMGDWEPMRTQA